MTVGLSSSSSLATEVALLATEAPENRLEAREVPATDDRGGLARGVSRLGLSASIVRLVVLEDAEQSFPREGVTQIGASRDWKLWLREDILLACV